jgi:hypothetical protein
MSKRKLHSEARLAFSKELISFSQEIQQLEANLRRCFWKNTGPGAQFVREAPPEEVGILNLVNKAFSNNLAELREMVEKASSNVKTGHGFFEK